MDLPTPGRRQIAHHLLDHAEQRLDLLTLAAREVVGREHPQRDDRDADLVAPLDELFEFVGAGLVTRDERLPGALVRAQRRLPSASTATWRGSLLRSSSAISRCS